MAADKKHRGPHVRRGNRRVTSLPGQVGGYELRSQLEARFAQELQRREITWRYEPERISAAHYLVDFYLPDLKCWVEVKGRFDSKESLELPVVANFLKRERGERLFLYMDKECYLIRPRGYDSLTIDEFWEAVLNPPEDAGKPDTDEPRTFRRPWPRR